MRWLKMFIVLLISIVVLFVGIMFTIHNTDKVAIDLIFIQLPEASLSLWLIAFFVSGGVLGTILSTFAVIGLKTKLNLSNRRAETANKELAAYRA